MREVERDRSRKGYVEDQRWREKGGVNEERMRERVSGMPRRRGVEAV